MAAKLTSPIRNHLRLAHRDNLSSLLKKMGTTPMMWITHIGISSLLNWASSFLGLFTNSFNFPALISSSSKLLKCRYFSMSWSWSWKYAQYLHQSLTPSAFIGGNHFKYSLFWITLTNPTMNTHNVMIVAGCNYLPCTWWASEVLLNLCRCIEAFSCRVCSFILPLDWKELFWESLQRQPLF